MHHEHVDQERGLGSLKITAEPALLEQLAVLSDGDLRRSLNALEVIALSKTVPSQITSADIEAFARERRIRYDSDEDEHYDTISAFIKSCRGSDPDAAMYWLAKMLAGGEDPRFIARRLVIAASEDVGNADPMALVVANSAAQATEMVGMPECRIILSQAVIYVALAPKSNASYKAVEGALADVRERRVLPVPTHLRDASYGGAKRLGHGQGYEYAHDSPDGWVDQDYLGVDREYYQPVDRGLEADLRRRLEEFRRRKTRGGDDSPSAGPPGRQAAP